MLTESFIRAFELSSQIGTSNGTSKGLLGSLAQGIDFPKINKFTNGLVAGAQNTITSQVAGISTQNLAGPSVNMLLYFILGAVAGILLTLTASYLFNSTPRS
ncbi:hypothetical protein HYT33_02340 [Candidatus Roizmanbacteria bacterium]|nr:hypothetical protein [Candidatus Roizmanbacteria bacterium]